MNKTLILMILDVSGSMGSVMHSMQKSFNQIIEDQSTERGDADLSVFTFATDIRHDITPTSFKNKPNVLLRTRGCTAFYDAVIEAINSVSQDYTNMLVLIQTDGEDNESTNSPSTVRNIIEHKIDKGWQFLYMGAEVNVSHEASRIGLKNYAVEFKRDNKGIEQVFNEMSRKISNFRAFLDDNILQPN